MTDKHFIYMDNAATTMISDEVFGAMLPYLKEEYGNPSSIYSLGRRASLAIEEARDTIAKAIGAKASEIFFTSGGSEADNWAIKSAAKLAASKGKNHIISSTIEHHAVLHTLDALKKEGFEVTLLPVDEYGLVSADQLEKAITDKTGLVTIMYANNEIGTIAPIGQIGKICRDKGIYFHTDAVQAMGQVEIDVTKDNIDLLNATAHKIHGPKGVGFLYIRTGIRLENLIDGGAQERGRRGGTENVAGIVGLAKAVELATTNIPEKSVKLREKTKRIINALTQIPHSRLNGHPEKRLANNVNISFEGIEGESILLMLDNAGIAASSGSACTSGSLDPSHVLLAIGLPHETAHGSLRISISQYTTDTEVDYLLETIPGIIVRLRDMSPLWDTIIKNEK